MRRAGKWLLGLIGGAALVLGLGGFSRALPAAAQSPGLSLATPLPTYVAGINGSFGSIAQIQATMCGSLPCSAVLYGAPVVTLATAPGQSVESLLAVATEPAIESIAAVPADVRINRDYAQVSGKYCTDKTGGKVFVADGSPVSPALTC